METKSSKYGTGTNNKKLYNGLFVVDKPKGITSFEVVQRIRKRTGIKQVGHTGTLDPLATGVLPVCMGEATKLVSYLFAGDRQYEGEFLLGIETDTEDITGTILNRKDATHIQTSSLEEIFWSQTGTHLQVPPQFSAIKYKGKPSYYWARKGIAVPRKERHVHIEALHLRKREGQKVFFDMICSGGTYVRSMVSEVGRLLGCGACLTGLRRLQCGPFFLEGAVPLERLEASFKEKSEDTWFWPIIKLLPEFEPVYVEEDVMRKLQKGIAIPNRSLSLLDRMRTETGKKIKVMYKDNVIALAEFRKLNEEIMLQPIRILHTTG